MFSWRRLFLLLSVLALVATACSSDDGDSDTTAAPQTVTSIVEVEVPGETVTVTSVVEVPVTGETITFWSTETQPERLAITQGIIDRFTAQTGIGVVLVATDEGALPSLMSANAASGTLPDVIFHPLDFTIGWANQGLLDLDAAAAVVDSLGADTFAQGSLDLVSIDGSPAAVPSDGWGQLLIYRQDLFDAAGLAAPTSYDLIQTAAETLHDPGNNFVGITAATDGGQPFTQQTFEHFALANGCQLVDDGGNVTLDTPECVEAIDFFTTLLNDYSVEGVQDVVTTRATYFAGQAAMIVWSPFIMDEMAGLRDAATPACPECDADIAYLARNSGFVPSFSGPSGAPAQYGQVSYMGIGDGANVPAAQQFLEYWFNDGYVDWLSTSPEGKFPMRRGTSAGSAEFIDGWKALETGVDRKASLSEFYGDEVIQQLIDGSSSFDRWGFTQGQGELVTAIYSSLPVPQAVRDVLDGSLSAAEAAAEMQAAVEEELELLSE
ncbi:MAG: extracellular solute-binding protein [Acidimicrobiia bacterium]|nr:extracellular solute-binding protein [Acidimicrobiia bacterium]